MGKTSTTNFDINAAKAVKAIDGLEKRVAKYNQTARETNKANAALTAQTKSYQQAFNLADVASKQLNRTLANFLPVVGRTEQSLATLSRTTKDFINFGVEPANIKIPVLKVNIDKLEKAVNNAKVGFLNFKVEANAAATAIPRFENNVKQLQKAVESTSAVYDPFLRMMQGTVTIKDPFGPWVRGLKELKRQAFDLSKLTPFGRPAAGPTTAAHAAFVGGVKDPFLPSGGKDVRSRSADDAFRAGVRLLRNFNDLKSSADRKNVSLGKQNSLHDSGTAAAGRQRTAINFLTRDWGLFTRVLFVAQVHRAINLFTSSLTDAVREAHQLSIRIAEIQTIQGGANIGTAQWASSLRNLSNDFGIPILQAAEGAYQAISNQVVSAANATSFLREETKLAKTTVATLDQAVSATSSVINAFNFSLGQTHDINAKLFKAVEIGRFRLDELGSQFGRTSILASQLGVSLDEELGALTLLTRKGLQADVALTLLTNVFNSLLKPSKELNGWLTSIGVSSGQAAIRTFGFANVMGKLAAEADKSSDGLTDIASKFQDLRALTGAGALTGFFNELTDDISKLKTATKDFDRAITTTFQSLGQRATKQLTELRNTLVFQFGQPILKAFVDVSESVGGASRAFNTLFTVITRGTIAYTAYRLSIAATAGVQALLNNHQLIAIGRATTLAGAYARLQVVMRGATAGFNLWALAIGAAVTVIADARIRASHYGDTLESLAQKTRTLTEETSERRLKGNVDRLNKSFELFSESVKRDGSAIDIFIAGTRAKLEKVAASYESTFKKLASSIHKTFTEIESAVSKSITATTRESEKLLEAAERARTRVTDIRDKESGRRIDALLDGEDSIAKFEILEREKLDIHRRAVAARTADDERSAEHLFELEEKLSHKQAEILRKLREDALKEKEKDVDSRVVPRTDAFGRPRLNRFGQPTFTRKRTTSTVAAPDTETADRLLSRLNALEAERLRLVNERVALETAAAKRAEDAAKKATDDVKKRETAFERLKALLESLEEGKTPAEFKKGRIEVAGLLSAAGVDPGRSLDLVRDLKRKEVLLVAQAEQEKLRKVIEAEEKKKNVIEKAILDEEQKRNKAKQDALTSTEQALKDSEVLLTTLNQFSKDTDIFKKSEGGIFKRDDVSNKEFETKLQSLNSLLDLIKGKTGAGKDASKDLKTFNTQLNELVGTLSKIGPENVHFATIRNALGNAVIRSNTFASTEGKLTSSTGGEAFTDQVKKVQDFVRISIEANDKVSKSVIALTEQRRQLAEQAAKVPKSEIDAAKASADWADRSKSDSAIINGGLGEIITSLDAIRRRIETMPSLPSPTGTPTGKAWGGSVKGHSFGRGIDSQLGLFSPSEIIMKPSVSQAFAPFLHALNRGTAATGFGNTTNFGDITINTSEGTSSDQAVDMVRQLKRLTRRGLY